MIKIIKRINLVYNLEINYLIKKYLVLLNIYNKQVNKIDINRRIY